MDETKPKNQHWVPRFYLKGFSIPSTKSSRNPKVWILNKDFRIKTKVSTKDVAAKRYLYSPKNSDGQRSWDIEHSLGDVESMLSKFWSPISTGYVDLGNKSIRKGLSLFIAMLYLRHPKRRDEYQHLQNTLIEALDSFPKDDKGRPLLHSIETKEGKFEYNPIDWRKYSNPSNYDREKFFADNIVATCGDVAEILLKKRWSIIHCERPLFATSDKPVSIFNLDKQRFGLETPRTIIHFPLSPTRILMLDDRYDMPDSEYYELDNNDPRPANFTVWTFAYRFIISHRHPDEFIQELKSIYTG